MLVFIHRNTFPLKMAPWIRVNGSVNRRVLDKYAGTVLLHCIENVGTTLYSLCTRFHYLFPVHVHELMQVDIKPFHLILFSTFLSNTSFWPITMWKIMNFCVFFSIWRNLVVLHWRAWWVQNQSHYTLNTKEWKWVSYLKKKHGLIWCYMILN